MRKTKIVCTIGPATDNQDTVLKLIEQGMDVARLNFSHGTHQEHKARIEMIKIAAKKANKPIAIMLDTKGPEIRTGLLREGKINLSAGQQITLSGEDKLGNEQIISINYPELYRDVLKGQTILFDDGLIALEVEDISNGEIICRVLNGGELGEKKGVNVPGANIKLPAITAKDRADIEFGIENGMDFIAASFVRTPADVIEIKKILEEFNSDIHIIAKIENRQGVDNLDDILKVADGIMVARGDLGVEIPAEEVPLIQKLIIKKCNQNGKPVITATQMLDSMIRNPRPTRAEASDVANAILDGTDAVMLSGETAAGKYPLEAVKTMAEIAVKAETALEYGPENRILSKIHKQITTPDAISYATVTTAYSLDASAIITATHSGSTARMVSKYRPKARILAVTPLERVCNKLQLLWGVFPLTARTVLEEKELLEEAVNAVVEAGQVNPGDLVVITAGMPTGIPGTTNILKVEVVGQIIAKGMGIGRGGYSGKILFADNLAETKDKISPGDILVVNETNPDYISLIEIAGGLITVQGGLTSHVAIACLNLGKPVIVGVVDAFSVFKEREEVTLDVARGVIYKGIIKIR